MPLVAQLYTFWTLSPIYLSTLNNNYCPIIWNICSKEGMGLYPFFFFCSFLTLHFWIYWRKYYFLGFSLLLICVDTPAEVITYVKPEQCNKIKYVNNGYGHALNTYVFFSFLDLLQLQLGHFCIDFFLFLFFFPDLCRWGVPLHLLKQANW